MSEPKQNDLMEWVGGDGKKVTERVLRDCLPANVSRSAAFVVIRVILPSEEKEAKLRKEKLSRPFPFLRYAEELMVAFADERVRILKNDVFLGFYPVEDVIPVHHREKRDKNYDLIKVLVKNGEGNDLDSILYENGRGKAVADLANASGRQKNQIYDYLSLFWQRGQERNSLLPRHYHYGPHKRQELKAKGRKRGPKGHKGISIGEIERQKLEAGVTKYILGKKEKIEQAYLSTMADYWHAGSEMQGGSDVAILLEKEDRPTERQFRYVYQKMRAADPERFGIARMGKKKWERENRKCVGELTQQVRAAGTRYIVDWTPADVELVGEVHRGTIGSANIGLVIDALSHDIAGANVTLEEESVISTAIALENAFTEKASYCAAYGVSLKPGQWPHEHLPHEVEADRKLVFQSADAFFKGLGVRVRTLPGGKPEWKGVVERFFCRLNQRIIHSLPGAKLRRERGDKNPKIKATLTLRALTKLVILTILEIRSEWMPKYRPTKQMMRDGVDLTPHALWTWSIAHNGSLRQRSREYIRAQILPRNLAGRDSYGLVFRGVRYTLPPNFGPTDVIRILSPKLTMQYSIAYEPNLMNAIFLRAKATGALITCPLHPSDSRFENLSWAEHDALKKDAKSRAKAQEGEEEQRSVATSRQIKDTVDSEAALTSIARPNKVSERSLITGVKARRDDERRRERIARSTKNILEDVSLPKTFPVAAPNPEPEAPIGPTDQKEAAPSNITPFPVNATMLRELRKQKNTSR